MTPNGKTPRKGDEYLSNRCDNLSLSFLPRGPEMFCSVLPLKEFWIYSIARVVIWQMC